MHSPAHVSMEMKLTAVMVCHNNVIMRAGTFGARKEREVVRVRESA